jgi:hypothetical protein
MMIVRKLKDKFDRLRWSQVDTLLADEERASEINQISRFIKQQSRRPSLTTQHAGR